VGLKCGVLDGLTVRNRVGLAVVGCNDGSFSKMLNRGW
jgi:hypothetical protein